MSPSLRKTFIALLLIICFVAVGRVARTYYDFLRTGKTEEAGRRRKDELIKSLLERQDAPPATRDGQFPCVFVMLVGAAAPPELGKCTVPVDRSAAVDRAEVDLRYGNFLVRQTDLYMNDVSAVPSPALITPAIISTRIGATLSGTIQIILLIPRPWERAIHIPTKCWFSKTATICFSIGYLPGPAIGTPSFNIPRHPLVFIKL